jgi:hypothetical protein
MIVETTIDQVLNEYDETIEPKDVNKADKVFETLDEYVESPEFLQSFMGYNSDKEKARLLKTANFVRGFAIAVNPETNYGRPFKLYRIYTMHTGKLAMIEQSPGAMLSKNKTFAACTVYLDGFVMAWRRMSNEDLEHYGLTCIID